MKSEQIGTREESIVKMMSSFPYRQLHRLEFSYSNLNALKYFKMFEDTMEFSFNRKNHKSFVWYFKGIMEHKDIDIGDWSPSITEFYNSGNQRIIQVTSKTRLLKSLQDDSAAWCQSPAQASLSCPNTPKHSKSSLST